MAKKVKNPDSVTGKVTFTQFNKPILLSGNYKVVIEQKISSRDRKSIVDSGEESLSAPKIDKNNIFTSSRSFAVGSDRFSLQGQQIIAAYPPPGSQVDHTNVLPHIMLKRSTLPWERSRDKTPDVPWMMVLLFDESEIAAFGTEENEAVVKISTIKASDLNSNPLFPKLPKEAGDDDAEMVTVIDAQWEAVKDQLPTTEDLALLGHVRQTTDSDNEGNFAVVLGNRIPGPGLNTAHLVSLEGYYKDASSFLSTTPNNAVVRLVSLASWRFSCPKPKATKKQGFTVLLEKLNRTPSTLRIPDAVDSAKNTAAAMEIRKCGYVALKHYMRRGGRTISLYHSPLIPSQQNKVSGIPSPPYHTADELYSYRESFGLFDIANAAAWELGRNLTLKNKAVAMDIFHWKRQHTQELKHRTESKKKYAHLLQHKPSPETERTELKPNIRQWFDDLRLLKHVPVNYLIPDEAMLPVESIRFFHIDTAWVNCLVDGAFSVGRVTPHDAKTDEKLHPEAALYSHEVMTGVLIRSSVVSGWPGLHVDAYAEKISNDAYIPVKESLDVLRMERLSEHLLLIIFRGVVQTLDIHQKPEMMHFGLTRPHGKQTGLTKALFNRKSGKPRKTVLTNLPWKSVEKRVLNIKKLADMIQARLEYKEALNSADFAMEMIEGVEKVRFVVK